MLEKFNKACDDLLSNIEMNGRLFYESTNGSINKSNFSKISYINISTAEEFYEKAIPIKDDKIINEAHDDANFSSRLINKIFNSQNFDKLENFEIYKKNLKDIKQIPIYIFKFDFSNPDEIINIFNSFHIEFSLKNGSLDEKINHEKEKFKSLYQTCNGIFIGLGSCAFLMFNINNFSKSTIQHEMIHYIQYTSNKDDNEIEFNENVDIPELQLNNEQLKYLFNYKEFEAHIKVDLINQLTELYYKKYKNKFDKKQFCINFIRTVQKDPENAPIKFAIILSNLKNNDNTALRLFAACYTIKNK